MYYSLRNKNIQKKNRIKSIILFALTLVTIGIFSVLGIRILVNIINIVTDIKKSDQNQTSNDTIPPRIPYVYPFPEYTSDPSVDIKGEAESASTVVLNFNNHKSEVVAGNTGSFIFKLDLSEGKNDFFLYSKDSAGNISPSTKTYSINFDKTPPEISISSPSDNSTFYGMKNKTVEIKGTCEADATITINDRYVTLSDDGNFIFKYELQTGENKLKIKAQDLSGNTSEKELTLIYQE